MGRHDGRWGLRIRVWLRREDPAGQLQLERHRNVHDHRSLGVLPGRDRAAGRPVTRAERVLRPVSHAHRGDPRLSRVPDDRQHRQHRPRRPRVLAARRDRRRAGVRHVHQHGRQVVPGAERRAHRVRQRRFRLRLDPVHRHLQLLVHAGQPQRGALPRRPLHAGADGRVRAVLQGPAQELVAVLGRPGEVVGRQGSEEEAHQTTSPCTSR